ncbi:hypothetical protein SAMN05660653_02101 [Desulfonatronum thiosulfatophilum]|uniref:Uncharacterized protein n=1 Tax=Desulfonatronum thiosulfatophilum TaxID=617002 RepID=A0A1G6DE74_9BACT|nr:hypothetical protein [Desulfonatronum thiosulfatophilum]SDB43421.1 hypothetical protein SAMN05660653_02101 [Desulfonatronum thiosulfatophilum]
MAEDNTHGSCMPSETLEKHKQVLKWEVLAHINRGPMASYEKLHRARFGNGWLVKYEFVGGRAKSGCFLVYVDDPRNEWVRGEEKLKSNIINYQHFPSQFLVIRQFEAHPGSFLTVAAGTRQMFWTQLLFVPAVDEEQQDIALGIEHDQNA